MPRSPACKMSEKQVNTIRRGWWVHRNRVRLEALRKRAVAALAEYEMLVVDVVNVREEEEMKRLEARILKLLHE